MRLIDADELHDVMRTKQKWIVKTQNGEKHNEGYTYDQVHFAIDEAPTVDPVKHGRWEDVEPAPWGQVYETCSECGTRQALDRGKDKFCGVCGVKMDGENDEID